MSSIIDKTIDQVNKSSSVAEDTVVNFFKSHNITINGLQPWDIQVYDKQFYEKVFYGGSLAFGEAYMDELWKVHKLDEMIYRLFSVPSQKSITVSWSQVWAYLKSIFFNLQSKKRALLVGRKHYDLGNDLFKCMLDKRMAYSCGYWKNAKNLDEAQEAKLELICQKLNLQPGMRILDIGCGWGSFAKYAAEKYSVSVVGITISKRQLELAQEMCAGLPIELRFQDYRDLNETFDHIVSIGQFEHVGHKNYSKIMKKVSSCLSDKGLFLLHTIGNNITVRKSDPWIEKYIFPNGLIPSIKQISKAYEGVFVMEDCHNFGSDYDKTLMAWFQNFDQNWEKLQDYYDERFYQMWKYYLLTCAGVFRARGLQLWQFVFSKNGVPGGYSRKS
jgi:cyclopropane-fatty-acyl-phospholipid synthase